MKRAMARQAEAERERRAKVVNALGEFQASTKLVEAARIMSRQPISVQLRFLQTVSEIAAENNSTTLFPIPMDLFEPFMRSLKTTRASEESEAELEGTEETIPELPPPERVPDLSRSEEPARVRKRDR